MKRAHVGLLRGVKFIALTFPTNSGLKESSVHMIIPELKKSLNLYSQANHLTHVQSTGQKAKFHWTSGWPYLFLFHLLSFTDKCQHIQEKQHYVMWLPIKSKQGFSACRKHNYLVTKTLKQCNTKYHNACKDPSLTHEQPPWTVLSHCTRTAIHIEQKQLGKGLGSEWKCSQPARIRLQKESAMQGRGKPPARAERRPVLVWWNKAAKK